MGAPLAPITTSVVDRLNVRIFDEFASYTDTQLWTKLASDTNSTVAHEGTAGGKTRLKLVAMTTDNNESAVKLTNKVCKFLASKPMECEALIQYAEGNTSAVNLACGFASAIAADVIADDGGAIAATDAALIYKKDGDTVWSFHTEINNAGDSGGMGYSSSGWNESTSTTTAGGTSAQRLTIECIPRSSSAFECRPYVDGVQLKTSAGVPIMHVITLGTATDMTAGLYLKTGSTTTETVYVDYAYVGFAR